MRIQTLESDVDEIKNAEKKVCTFLENASPVLESPWILTKRVPQREQDNNYYLRNILQGLFCTFYAFRLWTKRSTQK